MNAKSTKAGVPIWTDALYNIPVLISDQEKVYKRLETLVELYVSEDLYKEDDWKYLTTWMAHKKNLINHVTFRAMILSSKNLQYISEILSQNKKIKTVVFYNFTIKDDRSFQDFCSTITKIKKIDRLRITLNDLSFFQIQRLKESVDPSIKEVELIYEPIYFAMSDDAIYHQIVSKRRFLIGMKEINFIRDSGYGLIYALKNSPALEYVSLQSAQISDSMLALAAEAVTQNKSVTRVAFTTTAWDNHRAVFRELVQCDRITEISIDGSVGSTTLAMQSLSQAMTRPTLTCLKTESAIENDDFKPLYNIPNITELHVGGTHSGSSKLVERLAPNKYLKKLHIIGGHIKGFQKLSTMLSTQLTSLSISNTAFKIEEKNVPEALDICHILKQSTSITELNFMPSGTSYSWDGRCQKFDDIADILEVNSTLKSLTLRVQPENGDMFYRKFTDGLKTNKSLKHLKIFFDSNSYYELFAEALMENDTLTSLTLDGLDLRYTEPSSKEIQKLAAAFRVNTSLQSFSTNGINAWTEFMPILKVNQSLLKLQLTNTLAEVPNDYFLSELEKALEANTSLTSFSLLKSISLQIIDLPSHIQKLLLRNQKIYRQTIANIHALIMMISLRQEEFTAVFPLEIWLMILKRIKPSYGINFAEKLVASIKM